MKKNLAFPLNGTQVQIDDYFFFINNFIKFKFAVDLPASKLR